MILPFECLEWGEPWGGEYLLGTEEDRNSPNKEFYCFAEIHDVV